MREKTCEMMHFWELYIVIHQEISTDINEIYQICEYIITFFDGNQR